LASLQPLRSRNFALLWSAALVSNIGTWMQAVALGILVTARTHNPLWTGLVAAAAFLPNGLLAPFGGSLADRLDRRRWLLITTIAETCFAALLAVLSATGHENPAVLVVIAFFGGAAGAVGFPAYSAMLPDLIERREDLLAAVSLSSAQYNLGRVVGPLLAGVALAFGSYALAFAANALSFGAVIVALLLIRLPPPDRSGPRLPVLRGIAEGARIAFAEPGCRSAIGLIGVVALVASPFIALVPAMAIVGLHLGSHHRGSVGTSVLVTAQGIGAVAGVLVLPGLARRIGRARMLVIALFLLPVLLTGYALSPTLWVAALALLLVGAGYITVLSGLNTVVQLRAPEAARGRVLSLFMLSLGTLYPIGAVVQGAVADHHGVRVVTVAGALVLLAVLAVIALARPQIFTSLSDPVGASGSKPGSLTIEPPEEIPAV
jgi:MFS family permease